MEIGVKLNWKTETEISNYGFKVQRTLFKVQSQDWETLGFVEGHGISNSPKVYSFIDGNILAGKYSYRLKQIDIDGSFTYSDEIEVDITPLSFSIEQNYPNPFNPATTIKYSLPEQSKVVLKIYNTLGERVGTLTDEIKEAGIYIVAWDGSQISSGVYFYSIESKNENTGLVNFEVKKMLLLK